MAYGPYGTYSPVEAGTVINDNGLAVDIEALVGAASESDVLVVGFDFIAERVVIDFRTDSRGRSLPILELAEPMADAEERAAWLADRRPALSAPERFLFFVWPHSIGTLMTSLVAERILARIKQEHGLDYGPTLARIGTGLRQAERAEQVAAILGAEGFETVWSRKESQEG